MWAWIFVVAAAVSSVQSAGAGAARLVCYVESARETDGFSECTHLVYAGDVRGEKLDNLLKSYRKDNPRLKIILRVNEADKDLRTLLKSKHIQGLEIHNAHKSLNRTKILDQIEEARTALSSSGGGPLFLALPAHPELLAKYYDLRSVVKKVDLMMVQTHALGLVKKMTYHPSRLSGMWDMMNTDSVVDFVIGLGVPAHKLVISLPATARQFTLVNETLSTPGSPAVDEDPKEIDQSELCRQLKSGRWTLERDQDLSAPYAFKNKTWISFEDSSSIDVKGKYARVRGLAGLALHKADMDSETTCGPTLKFALAKVLNQQSRAPRAAVLRSLEHEILSAQQGHARALDALQVSPYRITQVVDSDGVIHSIREDTRTEFSCTRQGYFVHPRSCARFYRCVKFDQLSPEYTVFEFDCPAGLAFDSRYEVCVWPGSLPHSQACPGSSEIAPVPRTRFICPDHEGYYADPENCRWFFACLDHGKAPLTAYEFRCPFGLGFDAEKLKCDWPWVVPACGNIARYEAEVHGYSGAILTGATGFQGQTADAVNVAAHQSLISGASLNNLVGIQDGFLTKDDALDSNFIASQELANSGFGLSHGAGSNLGLAAGHSGQGLTINHGSQDSSLSGNVGLVQPTQYVQQPTKYTSGSIILDDYRLPTKEESLRNAAKIVTSHGQSSGQGTLGYTNGYSQSGYSSQSENGYAKQSGSSAGYASQSGVTSHGYTSQSGSYSSGQYNNNYDDNSGAYVHDPSGDYAEPYKHDDSPAVPYIHDGSTYKQTNDYFDYGKYSGSQGSYSYLDSNGYDGKYVDDNSGKYVEDNSGAYVDSNSGSTGYSSSGYSADYSGAYKHDDSGKYQGVYRADGHIGEGKATSSSNFQQYSGYSEANAGNYISNSKAFTGSAHTLTAGAVNAGLVGKTTLVDASYNDQGNYQGNGQAFSHSTFHVSQPAVSINHVGTDFNNHDGYSFVTTPTSSGVPTTAIPFAVTTALPAVTYKTTFLPEAPKTTIKQIFVVSQPAVTYVQPTVVPVKSTPQIFVTNHNQGVNYQYENGNSASYNSEAKIESGYDYSKPSIKFEDGISYTTAAPIASSYKPESYSHNQQTLHNVQSVGYDYSTASPVHEEPFKKIVAYTTGPSVTTYAQPTVATYTPQAISHQTIHKVESSNTYTPQVQTSGSIETGYDYSQSGQGFGEVKNIQYTTAQPDLSIQPIVSTYQPQVISHQTLHKVDASKINTYSGESGYNYEKPAVQFEEVKTIYSTPAPIATDYQPKSYSHQTIHKVESQQYVPSSTPKYDISYQSTPVTVYENPLVKYTQKVTPVTYVQPAYKSQAFSQQVIHKNEDSIAYGPLDVEAGYEYTKPVVSYQQPNIVQHVTVKPAVVQYTTSQPAVVQYTTSQPAVVSSTYQPQVFSHETIHKVDASKVKTSQQTVEGYEYRQPEVKFIETAKTVYSTPAPIVTSTYKPKSYSHQTIRKFETQNYVPVSSTPAPQINVYQPAVSTYENPFLKYTQKPTPLTYVQPTAAVYTQTYKPIIQQHEITHISQPVQYEQHVSQEGYSYNQPEIQRNIETSNSYSDASVVSHQTFHQSNVKSDFGKNFVSVSTVPSTLVYEDHYYDTAKEYKAPEYIPPKNDYKSYSVQSTTAAPIVQETYHQQNNYDYAQQFETVQKSIPSVQQISFSTSHIEQPQKVESVHFSSFPSTTAAPKYQQVEYQAPEIQVAYKAEEYLPPVVSTVTPIVTSTYRPRTYSTVSTTRDYLPPSEPKLEYLPPSTTARPRVKSTTPYYVQSTTSYKGDEYLPPQETDSKVVSYESYGFNEATVAPKIKYNPYQEYTVSQEAQVGRKHNLVVETAKSHQLGFGTVGPDAGLVSEVTYTTAAPVVSSTYRQRSKSTTPAYKYKSTTEYQAPEYLPPEQSQSEFSVNNYNVGSSNDNYNSYQEESFVSTAAPVQRKHNLVVEKSKSNLLGFGTVGPDAGLVSTYTTVAPVVSSSESYSLTPKVVTSTYAPIEQGLFEVTPSPVPVRRTKPKIAVVTKINDFNPFLVRKLGAVCSCQSPVLVLKGRRPTYNTQDFGDFNDYDDAGRGDIQDGDYAQRLTASQGYRTATPRVKTVTAEPIVTSTFNPIIVPDDSYYQDLQEQINYDVQVTPKTKLSSESYVSSTPYAASTTEKYIRSRPRVRVTPAPTIQTVLLKQEVAPTASAKFESDGDSAAIGIESQAFDRYGPGGWRSRDETLQGSVDCQRAGLFRHPKQCNKFYACRWDCSKQRFTLHVFNCPVQLSFDPSIGACNWPSQGPACQGDTLLTNVL